MTEKPDDSGSNKETRLRSPDLIEVMRKTIDRLVRDRTARGDLKILSRTLIELRYAFSVFRPYRRHRKVTVFGSARTAPSHPTFKAAEEFGRRMAAEDWMVVTGAGSGIMEAGHRGAGREHSMGLNIMLPFEQGANPVIEGDRKLVTMKYFFTRKLMFVKECHAVVSLPGGFGTLDETAEVMTLLQTGKHPMIPVVLLDAPGGTYWKEFGKFVDSQLLNGGMISPEDLRLYKITESVDEAVAELDRFYRVYHSMRYVNGKLVLRLQRPLGAAKLAAVNDRFSDIVVKGGFEQMAALPEEHSEAEIAELPRLVFLFNRRAMGRLRMLIDFINEDE
ncbi:TIGR00730 family Rossman fold protein [Rosistilla ulvae]|uniref:AMP nucleosidase n=1 Tax=Rosistilla ulvae TaxID=1930277 RepID=A0A517M5Y5_9BACT|nr:TIGR00730 family Rossman fold protein [Rosistilla ulvae]QDS90278.1 putative lysine decarboxylase [Rosistilla ulvae]